MFELVLFVDFEPEQDSVDALLERLLVFEVCVKFLPETVVVDVGFKLVVFVDAFLDVVPELDFFDSELVSDIEVFFDAEYELVSSII